MTEKDNEDAPLGGVRIDADLHRMIAEECERAGLKRSEVVRRALRRGLTAGAASPDPVLARLEAAATKLEAVAQPGNAVAQSTTAPSITQEQLDEAVNRILDRLGFLESEVPGRVEVVLRELLGQGPGPEAGSAGNPGGMLPSAPGIDGGALPEPVDPGALAGWVRASTSEAELQERVKMVPRQLQSAVMDAYVQRGKELRAARHPAAAIDHAQKLPFPGDEDLES